MDNLNRNKYLPGQIQQTAHHNATAHYSMPHQRYGDASQAQADPFHIPSSCDYSQLWPTHQQASQTRPYNTVFDPRNYNTAALDHQPRNISPRCTYQENLSRIVLPNTQPNQQSVIQEINNENKYEANSLAYANINHVYNPYHHHRLLTNHDYCPPELFPHNAGDGSQSILPRDDALHKVASNVRYVPKEIARPYATKPFNESHHSNPSCCGPSSSTAYNHEIYQNHQRLLDKSKVTTTDYANHQSKLFERPKLTHSEYINHQKILDRSKLHNSEYMYGKYGDVLSHYEDLAQNYNPRTINQYISGDQKAYAAMQKTLYNRSQHFMPQVNAQHSRVQPNTYESSRIPYPQSSYDGVLANHKLYQDYQQKNNSVIMKPESLHPSVIVSRPLDSNLTYTNRLQKHCRDQTFSKAPTMFNHNNNNYPSSSSTNMRCMEIKQPHYEDNYGPKYPKQDIYYNSRQPQYIYPSTIYSPNVISPTDSNVSDTSSTKQYLLDESNYVSRSSTSSSVGSVFNHDGEFKNPAKCVTRKNITEVAAKENYASDVENFINTSIVKRSSENDKDKLDLRKFLSTWDETDDEVINQETEKNITNVSSNEQLYVLEYTDISSEDLDKYKHITQVTKLPENICGFSSVVNDQSATGMQYVNNEIRTTQDVNANNFNSSKENSSISYNNLNCKTVEKTDQNLTVISTKINDNNISCSALDKSISKCQETNLQLIERPPSPVDIETILSQSVISKDAIACSFDIKPCDAVQKQLTVHISHTDIQPNNADLKTTTDIGVQTLCEQNIEKLNPTCESDPKRLFWNYTQAQKYPKSIVNRPDYYQQNSIKPVPSYHLPGDSNTFTNNYVNDQVSADSCRYSDTSQEKSILTDCMYGNSNTVKDFSVARNISGNFNALSKEYNGVNFSKDSCKNQVISKTPISQIQKQSFSIDKNNGTGENLIQTDNHFKNNHMTFDSMQENITRQVKSNIENKFQILSDVLITDRDKKHILKNCNYQDPLSELSVSSLNKPSLNNIITQNVNDFKAGIVIKSDDKNDEQELSKSDNIDFKSDGQNEKDFRDVPPNTTISNTSGQDQSLYLCKENVELKNVVKGNNSCDQKSADSAFVHGDNIVEEIAPNEKTIESLTQKDAIVESYSCKVLGNNNIKMIFTKEKSPKELKQNQSEYSDELIFNLDKKPIRMPESSNMKNSLTEQLSGVDIFYKTSFSESLTNNGKFASSNASINSAGTEIFSIENKIDGNKIADFTPCRYSEECINLSDKNKISCDAVNNNTTCQEFENKEVSLKECSQKDDVKNETSMSIHKDKVPNEFISNCSIRNETCIITKSDHELQSVNECGNFAVLDKDVNPNSELNYKIKTSHSNIYQNQFKNVDDNQINIHKLNAPIQKSSIKDQCDFIPKCDNESLIFEKENNFGPHNNNKEIVIRKEESTCQLKNNLTDMTFDEISNELQYKENKSKYDLGTAINVDKLPESMTVNDVADIEASNTTVIEDENINCEVETALNLKIMTKDFEYENRNKMHEYVKADSKLDEVPGMVLGNLVDRLDTSKNAMSTEIQYKELLGKHDSESYDNTLLDDTDNQKHNKIIDLDHQNDSLSGISKITDDNQELVLKGMQIQKLIRKYKSKRKSNLSRIALDSRNKMYDSDNVKYDDPSTRSETVNSSVFNAEYLKTTANVIDIPSNKTDAEPSISLKHLSHFNNSIQSLKITHSNIDKLKSDVSETIETSIETMCEMNENLHENNDSNNDISLVDQEQNEISHFGETQSYNIETNADLIDKEKIDKPLQGINDKSELNVSSNNLSATNTNFSKDDIGEMYSTNTKVPEKTILFDMPVNQFLGSDKKMQNMASVTDEIEKLIADGADEQETENSVIVDKYSRISTVENIHLEHALEMKEANRDEVEAKKDDEEHIELESQTSDNLQKYDNNCSESSLDIVYFQCDDSTFTLDCENVDYGSQLYLTDSLEVVLEKAEESTEQNLHIVLVEKKKIESQDLLQFAVKTEECNKELSGNDYFLCIYNPDMECISESDAPIENCKSVPTECSKSLISKQNIEQNLIPFDENSAILHDLQDELSLNNFPFVEEIVCDKKVIFTSDDDSNSNAHIDTNETIISENVVLDTKINTNLNTIKEMEIGYKKNNSHNHLTDQNKSALLENGCFVNNAENSKSLKHNNNSEKMCTDQQDSSNLRDNSELLVIDEFSNNSNNEQIDTTAKLFKLRNMKYLEANNFMDDNKKLERRQSPEVFLKDEISNNVDDIFINKSLKFSKIENIQDILQKVKKHNFRSVKVVNRNTKEIIEYRSIDKSSANNVHTVSNIDKSGEQDGNNVQPTDIADDLNCVDVDSVDTETYSKCDKNIKLIDKPLKKQIVVLSENDFDDGCPKSNTNNNNDPKEISSHICYLQDSDFNTRSDLSRIMTPKHISTPEIPKSNANNYATLDQSFHLGQNVQNAQINKNKYIYIDPNKIEQDFNSNLNNLNIKCTSNEGWCNENSANDTNSNYEFFDMIFKKLLNDRYKVKRKIKLNDNVNLCENDSVFNDVYMNKPKQIAQNNFDTKDKLDQRRLRKSVITHSGFEFQNKDSVRKHNVNIDFEDIDCAHHCKETMLSEDINKKSHSDNIDNTFMKKFTIQQERATDIIMGFEKIDSPVVQSHEEISNCEENQLNYDVEHSLVRSQQRNALEHEEAISKSGSSDEVDKEFEHNIYNTKQKMSIKPEESIKFQPDHFKVKIKQRNNFYNRPKIQRRHSIAAIYYTEQSTQNLNEIINNLGNSSESADKPLYVGNSSHRDNKGYKLLIRKRNFAGDYVNPKKQSECVEDGLKIRDERQGHDKERVENNSEENNSETKFLSEDLVVTNKEIVSSIKVNDLKLLNNHANNSSKKSRLQTEDKIKVNRSIDVYSIPDARTDTCPRSNNMFDISTKPKIQSKSRVNSNAIVKKLHDDKCGNNNNNIIENNNKFDSKAFSLNEEFEIKTVIKNNYAFSDDLSELPIETKHNNSNKYKYKHKTSLLDKFNNEANEIVTCNSSIAQVTENVSDVHNDPNEIDAITEDANVIEKKSNKVCLNSIIPKNQFKEYDLELKAKSRKRNFEDALNSIDEQYHSKSLKKKHSPKHVIPKLVIKKDDYGVHYASEKESSSCNSALKNEEKKSLKSSASPYKNKDMGKDNVFFSNPCTTERKALKLRISKSNLQKQKSNIPPLKAEEVQNIDTAVSSNSCILQTRLKVHESKLMIEEINSRLRDTDLKLEAFSNFNSLSVNLEKRDDINYLSKVPGSRIKVLPNDSLSIVDSARSFKTFGANTINIDGLSQSSK